MVAAHAERRPWLFGPGPDLLFGCGLLYALCLGLMAVLGPVLRTSQPSFLFPLLILLFSQPHYGATLVRVYGSRAERQRYSIFSVWITLGLVALFLLALRMDLVGSLLVTVYLTWSAWHYTGQNYGVGVMMAGRGGVPMTKSLKRIFHASFNLSFLLVALALHAQHPGVSPADTTYALGNGVRFIPLGIPTALNAVVVPLVVGAYVACVALSVVLLLREASLRAMFPVLMLMASQALWFTLPFTIAFFRIPVGIDAFNWDFHAYYFVWIALAHAVQYLWVTTYYAQKSENWTGPGRYWLKTLLAGSAVWFLPVAIVGASGAWPKTIDVGLGLVLASVVNLHHFILDGAIWKLRGRIGEVLIRDQRSTPESAGEGLRRLGRPLVWASCAAALLLSGWVLVENEQALAALHRADPTEVVRVEDRLRHFGYDKAKLRLAAANIFIREGAVGPAREQLERAVDLRIPRLWVLLARTYQREGDWAGAARVYQRALDQDGDQLPFLAGAAVAWVKAGRPAQAVPFAERALHAYPQDKEARRLYDYVSRAQSNAHADLSIGAGPKPSALQD